MKLTRAQRDAAIDQAVVQTDLAFALEIASRTKLTTNEVMALVKTEAERKSLALVIDVVRQATADNQAQAMQIRQIAGGVEALVKIASRLV